MSLPDPLEALLAALPPTSPAVPHLRALAVPWPPAPDPTDLDARVRAAEAVPALLADPQWREDALRFLVRRFHAVPNHAPLRTALAAACDELAAGMPREAVYTAHAAAATATLNSLLGSGPPWPRGAPGAREWASLVAALAEWPAGVEMGVRPSYYMFVRAAMKATRGVLVRLGCPAAEKWARTAPEVLIGGPVEPLGEEEGREALAAAVEAAAAVVLPPGFAESLEGSADEYDVLELADLMHLAAASAGELGMPGCAARAGEIRGRLLSLGGSHEELRRERAQRGLDMIS